MKSSKNRMNLNKSENKLLDLTKRGSLPTKIFIDKLSDASGTDRKNSDPGDSNNSPGTNLSKKIEKSPSKSSTNNIKIPVKRVSHAINSFKINSPNKKVISKTSNKHISTKLAINSISLKDENNSNYDSTGKTVTKPYSSSFCQPSYNSNPKEKNNFEFDKNTPKRSKTNKKINFDSNKSEPNDTSHNEFSSQFINFIKIFDKFKTLIQTARKDITDKSLLITFNEMNEEINEIHKSFQNQSIYESPLEYESSHESTSLNLELIEGSSERRKSIYKKFFDICQESVKQISLIFNMSMNITNNVTTNMPINIGKNITNNVTNNSNKTKNNQVQVNVNLNVKNIRNISPGRKVYSFVNKKHRTKRTQPEENCNFNEDSFDLSESQTLEGVSNRVPFKTYTVHKPKDEWVNYRMFTEGDFLEESEEENPIEKKPAFEKTRSKSLLIINNRNILTAALDFDAQRKPPKDNLELLASIMPDSNAIVSESEEESLSEGSDCENQETPIRRASEGSIKDNSSYFKDGETKRNSKCIIV